MTREFNEYAPPHDGRKIRLLCIVTQSEAGGAQQFLAQLVRRLDPVRFDISVAAGKDGGNELSALLPEHIPYTTIRSLRRTAAPLENLAAVWRIRCLIKHERPDVLLLMSSMAGFVGSLAAFLVWPRPAVIYRIGGWQFNDPLLWPKKIFYKLLEWISARWKDYIVVNSESDMRDARRLGIRPRHKLMVIRNGIDPYGEFLDRDTARTALVDATNISLPAETRFLVGTIANFYTTKSLDTLIRAAAYCATDTMFVIIGDGALRPYLERLITELDLSQRVFLVGKLVRAAQYLPAFDIFALTSVKEGSPWVILEAAAAKIPIVATRVGGVPEFIEHEKSGLLVEPRNPKMLATAINRAIHDDHLRKEMVIQAHQKLLAEYDVRQMIESFSRLIVDAAAHRSPR